MHFHLPKPMHGWRAFIGEVGIIVIGVLIALAADEAVETFRWRHQVALGEEELKAPIERDLANAAQRAMEVTCVARRLGDLSALLENAQAVGRLPAIGPIGEPPRGPWTFQTWDALVAGGIVAHMPQKKMMAYSALDRVAAYLSQLDDLEAEQWTILATMQGRGRRLSDTEAEQLRLTLARAAWINRDTARVGNNLRRQIKEYGLADPSTFAQADREAAARTGQASICQRGSRRTTG